MSKTTLFKNFTTFVNLIYGFTENIKKDLKSDLVTPQQNEILLCLNANHEISVSEVSGILDLNLPNTSRELKKLTELELIKKKPDPKDKRKSIIMLSDKGRMMMAELFSVVEKDFDNTFAKLSEDEALELEKAFQLIEDKLINKM